MPIQLEKEDLQEMMAQAMKTALEAGPAPSIGGARKEINEDSKIDAVSVKLPTFCSRYYQLTSELHSSTRRD